MVKFLGRLIGFVFIVGLIGAGVLAWGRAQFTAPGPLQTDTVVVIPRGASVEQIAAVLAQEGVIDDGDGPISMRVIFRYGDRAMRFFAEEGAPVNMRAGEYNIPAEASAQEVRQILIDGNAVERRFTAPEGFTSRQIVAQLAETEGLTGEVTEVPPEGSLLPETFYFQFGDSRQSMLERMAAAMDDLAEEAWPNRAEGLAIETWDEAVILASIVQEEAGNLQEMPRIAGVFYNRLNGGMRLQADATVEYGITLGEGPLGRGLLRSELEDPTPYNTYLIDGLPPTPIANPGADAIRAVLHPATHDELYFVADGTGGHAFAVTLEEHERNVARWREIEAARNGNGG